MGGKAFKNQKMCKIHTEHINDILLTVSNKLLIPVNDLNIVGSGSSPIISIINDLDIIIDQTKYNKHETLQNIFNAFGIDNIIFNKGTNVCSVALCFDNKTIQIDIIFSENIQWSKFAFCQYTNNKTQYKTVVRTLLLCAITTLIHQPYVDYFKKQNNQLLIRIGRTFDLIKGIRRIYQYKPTTNKTPKTKKNVFQLLLSIVR